MSRAGLANSGEAPGHVPGAFLCLVIRADEHDGFAKLLHAADHVLRAGRAPIPERQEHVACLRHLVVAAHASAFPKALPISAKELMPDGVLPGPAIAELIGAAGAAGDDLRDAVALRCQRLAQQLIVVKAATACDDDLHGDLLSCTVALQVAPWPRTVDAHRVVHRCGVAPRSQVGLPVWASSPPARA